MSLDGIPQYAMKRTHFKAKQIIGNHGFTNDDYDDIKQELLADLLQRLPKFNGDRANIKTFISRLIDNRLATLIQHRHAACRDSRRNQCSLADWVRDEFGAWARREAVTEEDRGRVHLGQAGRNFLNQLSLALDLADVVDSLPNELRDLCVRLRSQSVTEIARETGLSRARLRNRIRQIRARFIETGIDRY